MIHQPSSILYPSKKASALVISLLIIAVLATLAFGTGRIFVSQANITTAFEQTQGAFYAAQGKLESGIFEFRKDRDFEISEDGLDVVYRSPNADFTIKKDQTLELSTKGLNDGKIAISNWGEATYLQITEINVGGPFGQALLQKPAPSYNISPNAVSIRLKPLGEEIKLTVAADPPGIDSGTTTVTATGQKGRAKRKLEIKIDRSTDTLLGLFDYALLAEGGVR